MKLFDSHVAGPFSRSDDFWRERASGLGPGYSFPSTVMGGNVRKRSWVWLWLFVLGAVCSAAQRGPEGSSAGEQFVGTWTGTWDSAESSGGIELTLEKGQDRAVTGRVSVTGEPTYKAAFTALSFDGNKMSAKYDFPADPGAAEVILTAAFEGPSAKGTWSLREKATGNEAAAGGWTVTKK
jgi:hypothetical protein